MVRHFDAELNHIMKRLQYMGSLVESMISQAIQSSIKKNEQLKKEVLKWEEEVNNIQIEIDDLCITLIALQQPTAIDLRFITSAMKINSDLERMGDQAVNITEHCIEFGECMPQSIFDNINRMSEIVRKMVNRSLEAFIVRSVEAAKAVLLLDDQVDDLKDQVFLEAQRCIKEDVNKLIRFLDLILVSRHLERIGDHTTNISEDVIYMMLGKDIRHHQVDI